MSSTGIISRVHITPTTKHAENQRQVDSSVGGMAGPHEQQRRTIGIITKVHPDKPRLIKARSSIDSTPLANNAWIELNHSAQEIAERWGTVRVGFRVRVTFSGPSGAGADASIVGVEQQDVTEPVQSNEAARGLFAIFSPGIGIG
jgi:hypothetical protein